MSTVTCSQRFHSFPVLARKKTKNTTAQQTFLFYQPTATFVSDSEPALENQLSSVGIIKRLVVTNE